MGCLTSTRFNMTAEVMRQVTNEATPEAVDEVGEYVLIQDPDSGAFIRKWQPVNVEDNPATPTVNETNTQGTFPCIARGLIDGGIKVQGTTERWSEIYENVDYVKITFPAHVNLTKRDRVTNIRAVTGEVLWKEEEQPNSPPTVFSVMGVTPIVDPFGKLIEKTAMLERSEIQ